MIADVHIESLPDALPSRRERAGVLRPRWWGRWTTLVSAAAAGTVVIGLSYRLSGTGAPSDLYYIVFWVGMLVAALPAAGAMIARSSSSSRRFLALCLLAYVTAVPKFLRNPGGPLYHDEYAHWRQAMDVAATGTLGVPNDIIPIVEFYPGTSALTVVLSQLTGMSIWTAGLVIVAVTHFLALIAVLLVIGMILRSVRAGAMGALVYALNPSWLYFDTQYAYESVAIAYYLWVLAFAVLAARERSTVRRWAFVAGGILVGGASVVTHHLTTLALIGTLVLISGAILARRFMWRRVAVTATYGAVPPVAHPATWWVITAGVVTIAATWLLTVAGLTVLYLSPYAGASVQQLGQMTTNKKAGRQLLAASVQPLWERGLSALAPAIIGVICLVGVWIMWKERRLWPADALAIALFGLVYFPSVLFILAPMGAEGARRSWAFTFIGVALLVALVFQRKAGSWARRFTDRRRAAAVMTLVALVMIGNVGAGLNDPYRFPGPFRWGTDTNSASAEARSVAEVFGAQAGRVKVVADRYTRLPLSAFGRIWVATPSYGFPAGELVQSDRDPSRELAEMLAGSQIDYLVVDTRIAQEPAYNGDNFGSSDSLPGRATPERNLERLDEVPWASRVITSEHLRVYRLDMRALAGSGASR